MYKNIFVTGKVQCGKSTLINEILNELKLTYLGYRTLPYYKKEEKMGYYIGQASDLGEVMDKDKISIITGPQKCIVIVKGFSITGVKILDNSIKDKLSKIILLDEVGVLEKCSLEFREQIVNCLNSKKLVIGVLKQREDKFLKGIREREDTLVIDIEHKSIVERELIKKKIIKYVKEYIG